MRADEASSSSLNSVTPFFRFVSFRYYNIRTFLTRESRHLNKREIKRHPTTPPRTPHPTHHRVKSHLKTSPSHWKMVQLCTRERVEVA